MENFDYCTSGNEYFQQQQVHQQSQYHSQFNHSHINPNKNNEISVLLNKASTKNTTNNTSANKDKHLKTLTQAAATKSPIGLFNTNKLDENLNSNVNIDILNAVRSLTNMQQTHNNNDENGDSSSRNYTIDDTTAYASYNSLMLLHQNLANSNTTTLTNLTNVNLNGSQQQQHLLSLNQIENNGKNTRNDCNLVLGKK
jgi:hypothetical protein